MHAVTCMFFVLSVVVVCVGVYVPSFRSMDRYWIQCAFI